MQLVIETRKLFNVIVANSNVSINYLSDGIDLLSIIMWKQYAYCHRILHFCEFAIGKRVHKNHNIDKQFNFKLVMLRVFYMYFKYVLFPIKVVSKSPMFFANYFNIESEECMYTKKSWNLGILCIFKNEGGIWIVLLK